MGTYTEQQRLLALQAQGGMLLFTIERQDMLYKGMVLLSGTKDNHRTRIVSMKIYRYREKGQALF